MSNQKSTHTRLRFAPGFALLFALMLTLTTLTTALAAPLNNGDFTVTLLTFPPHDICSTTGWTESGDSHGNIDSVTASTAQVGGLGVSSSSDCIGRVYFPSSFSTGWQGATHTMSQTFDVPTGTATNAQKLNMYVWAKSQNGVYPSANAVEPTYKPQNISILAANGTTIVSISHNYNGSLTGVFSYDLAAYAGQSVTLKLQVSVNSLFTFSPDTVYLMADNVFFGTLSVPNGSGGMFDW